MNKFFQFLSRAFQRPDNEKEQTSDTQLNGSSSGQLNLVADDKALIDLMQLLEDTIDGKYTCEETLDLLDEYVELAADNQDVAAIMPLVKNHISDCPACTERYEALLKILQAP